MKRKLIILGLLLFVFALESSAQSSNPINPKIANGVLASNWPEAVALVSSNGNQSFCTGTLIGCETVLTAAHCVCGETDTGMTCQPDAAGVRVAMQHGPAKTVTSISVPANYVFGSAADVAVLKLGSPVDGIAPRKINTVQTPAFGSSGTIVGFGLSRDDLSDTGVKRLGEVTTASCIGSGTPENEHVCWNFTVPPGAAGTDSNTCPGDSGGPLFVDINNQTYVAGVTSGGVGACHANDSSFDADVFVNRAWIQGEAGADINSTSCGALPQVGQNNTTIIPNSGQLSTANTQGFHSFNVPMGTTVLRVNLNGDQTGNDFDLYVRQGSQPTLNTSDCGPELGGNFESCEFTNPTPGTWHVMASLFSGQGGTYQITATLFGTTVVSEAVIFNDDFEDPL